MKVDVLIVGGGPAGLARAFWLQRSAPSLKVLVVEAEARSGGYCWTRRFDGYSCEIGPQAFRPDEESDALIAALGMEDRVVPAAEGARLRWVAKDGRLQALPNGPGGLVRTALLSPLAKFRLLAEPFCSRGEDPEETLADFVGRRFGRQAIPLAEAMASGVYGGDAHSIEMASAFPTLAHWERKHGSLLKGARAARRSKDGKTRPALCTFRDGIEELIAALGRELADQIQVGSCVESITRDGSGWAVRLAGESSATIEADELVLAIPARSAAGLLQPVDSILASDLAGIDFASIANVYLGFEAEVGEQFPGFGFLLTAAEKSPVLGAIYCSSIFPGCAPAERFLVRVMAGGARFGDYLDRDDEEISDEAQRALQRYAGVTASPCFQRVVKLPRAIPQYTRGHRKRMERIGSRLSQLPGLILAGNSYEQVSLVGQLGRPEMTAGELKARPHP
ncbi:MAG: protoporphyrinogen oxidase [Planctomycetota bacterium]|nr:protoporphyrinogen oxidase [Planctomycetota bacterium]